MEHEDFMILSTRGRKNALESYIYEMRAKLSAEFKEYADAATVQTFLITLDQAENWLFGEGREQAKDTYEAKLGELQKVGGPIMGRYRAFEAAADRAIMLRNIIHKAADFHKDAMNKDEKYTAEDKDTVAKLITEQISWLNSSNNSLRDSIKTADPPVKEADFTERIAKIEETIKKMINKPKPEIKKETPATPTAPAAPAAAATAATAADVKKEEQKPAEKMEDVPSQKPAPEKMQP